MTKESVRSENGHKIVKHARQDAAHSLLSGPRIKMGYLSTTCLVILLLSVASAEEDDGLPPTETRTGSPPFGGNAGYAYSDAKSTNGSSKESSKQPTPSDDDDIAPISDLLLLERLIDGNTQPYDQNRRDNNAIKDEEDKADDIQSDSSSRVDSKTASESEGTRGEGDDASKPKNFNMNFEFVDSKPDKTSDSAPKFGQRSRNPDEGFQDGEPVLRLTQGGYVRPDRYRSRFAPAPDSSEQTEKLLLEPARNSNNGQREGRQMVLPQVTYSDSQAREPFGPFGNGPVLRSPANAPVRNVMTVNHVMPTTVPNGFLNAPPQGFPDYTATGFQPQFSGNEAAGFPNFDPNNIAFYQTSPRNPFQDTRFMFQDTSPVQNQPIMVDPTRNAPSQFQPNVFSAFPNFDNSEDNSNPNYGAYFRGPSIGPQYQIPTHFYGTSPNDPNGFNNPPINFLASYPDSRNGMPPQFFRPPAAIDAQNQRNSNDQQPDASPDENRANEKPEDESGTASSDESSSVPFGTRLRNEGDADVYMKYPTEEAGYAVEENLPPQNESEDSRTTAERANFPNTSPYANTLRNNQRRNITFQFLPPDFRDVPFDFGYQRPPVFAQPPPRNQGPPRFPGPDFNPGNPFNPAISMPDSNFQFLNVNSQRRGSQEVNRMPACAIKDNASICFEDDEYPGNDVLYSFNANSFLADRLSGPGLPLTSISLVEQNSSLTNETSDDYACSANTRYATPLRAKNIAGNWRVIVSLQGRFLQPVRTEICKSLGEPCSYAGSGVRTACVQKYNIQRLLSWSPDIGIHSDVYKLPVACSCQILEKAEA